MSFYENKWTGFKEVVYKLKVIHLAFPPNVNNHNTFCPPPQGSNFFCCPELYFSNYKLSVKARKSVSS